jgi:aminoglycoside phosphotransferase (APT) family kinase protein
VNSWPEELDQKGVGQRILPYVQRLFRSPDLAYRVLPKRIAHGIDSHTFEFELEGEVAPRAGLVLRIFRDPGAIERARREAVIQNTLVSVGFPAARVLGVEPVGVLSQPFLLMERLRGTPMLGEIGALREEGGFGISSARAILREAIVLPFAPRLMSDVQHRLHSVDPSVLTKALAQAGISAHTMTVDALLQSIDETATDFELDEVSDLLVWLRAHRQVELRHVVCHGDLHPLNVLLHRRRVMGVVDWSEVRLAEPELDVGFSSMALMTAPVEAPRLFCGVLEYARRQFSAAYLRAVRRGDLDAHRIEYYEVLRCADEMATIARYRWGGAYDPGTVWNTEAGLRELQKFARSSTRTFSISMSSGDST